MLLECCQSVPLSAAVQNPPSATQRLPPKPPSGVETASVRIQVRENSLCPRKQPQDKPLPRKQPEAAVRSGRSLRTRCREALLGSSDQGAIGRGVCGRAGAPSQNASAGVWLSSVERGAVPLLKRGWVRRLSARRATRRTRLAAVAIGGREVTTTDGERTLIIGEHDVETDERGTGQRGRRT